MPRDAPGVSIPRRRSSGAIHGCVYTSELQQRIGRCRLLRYRAASLGPISLIEGLMVRDLIVYDTFITAEERRNH